MTQEELYAKFPGMKPVNKAPTMWMVNGIGTTIYGKRDFDEETGSYVATLAACVIFVPLFFLRAYRVAPSPRGGWYFLGTAPLSVVTRSWNILVVLAILSTALGVPAAQYFNSPEYKAKQRMAEARHLAGEGQLAEAARLYQTLAIFTGPQSTEARQELTALVNGNFDAKSAAEAPGVFAAASKIVGRADGIMQDEFVATGIKVAQGIGDTSPKSSLALLDVLRPMLIDAREVDKLRMPLLKNLVALEPGNLEAAVGLAELLDDQQKTTEAKALLMPFKDKLGNGEGSRILGSIYVHEGDYDGAYTLLWPYVQPRLKTLHTEETNVKETIDQLSNDEIENLRHDRGPATFYKNYESAGSEDQKQALVGEYINSKLRASHELRDAQEKLELASRVVPVAMELGIAMLQRAQAMKDAAARKQLLEDTQTVFLSIQGAAGESDEYRLFLGEVYYWLGKQADGKKLFDDFLASKARNTLSLLQIASAYRGLGADPDARMLAEESYSKAGSSEERYAAANLRALVSKDADDRLEWLAKQNPDAPSVKGELGLARGEKAFEEGREAEAIEQLQIAKRAFESIPRNTYSLNELGLVSYFLFITSGDPQQLQVCVDSMLQAVALNPSDPVVLYNAGVTVLNATATDLTAKEIDLRSLRQGADLSLLRFLYRDEAGRDVVMKRLLEHPGTSRTMALIDKAILVSPKSLRGYSVAYEIYGMTHNLAQEKALEQRLRDSQVDVADNLADLKDYLAGKNDAKTLANANSRMKRSQDIAAGLKSKGGVAYAVALSYQVQQMLALALANQPVNADLVVQLATEARDAAPSVATDGMLATALEFRALNTLRREVPQVDQFLKENARVLGPQLSLVLLMDRGDDVANRLKANADVKRAKDMIVESESRFPSHKSVMSWAYVKHFDAAEAEKIAADVKVDEETLVTHSIDMLMNPYSTGEAIEGAWLYQIRGEPAKGREDVERIRKMGLPMPLK